MRWRRLRRPQRLRLRSPSPSPFSSSPAWRAPGCWRRGAGAPATRTSWRRPAGPKSCGRGRPPPARRGPGPRLGPPPPPAEAAAVRRLSARLAAGEDPAGWAAGDLPEATLLRHILAGRLDADYTGALRLGLFRPPPGDHGPVVRLVRAVWGAVALSDAQIDGIYGPAGSNGRPRSRLGYLGRRLARPFDLLLRLASYSTPWLKLRRPFAIQNPK